MKKILFLIPTLAHGGAEKVLVNLVNNLDQEKYDVTIKVMFDGGVNKGFLKPHIHYKYMFKKIFRGSAILFSMMSPEFLYKHLVKDEYDIVVSYLEGVTARIACGCKSKKVSWIHIEMLDDKTFTLGFRSKQEALKYYTEMFVYQIQSKKNFVLLESMKIKQLYYTIQMKIRKLKKDQKNQ